MGVLIDSFTTLMNMTKNDEAYEVNDDDSIILYEFTSAEERQELLNAMKNADKFAEEIEDRQKNSITLRVSEMAIRAKNKFEMLLKSKKIDAKLARNLNKKQESTDVLKKDSTVSYVESTNGNIEISTENNTRKREEHVREERIK